MPDKNGDFTLQELQKPATPLAKLYHKKLPRYGWAGSKNATEKAYIKWFKDKQGMKI